MNTSKLCLLLLFFAHSQLFAQFTLKGVVMDKTENEPIEYASVALYTLSDSLLVNGAVTSPEGKFALHEVAQADYYLSIKFIGYKTYVQRVMTNSAEILDLGQIYLVADTDLLEEVEISGQKLTAINKIDRQSYNTSNFKAARGGTASDVLKNLPGVSVDINGHISVRGSTGFVVLLNDKPLQSDPMMILSQLPANSIESIEFITTPSARYDPEGKGGILNITTIKEFEEGTYFQINGRYGLPSIEDYESAEPQRRYGIDFNLSHTTEKWNFAFGGSFLRNDRGGRREGDVYTIVNDTVHFFPSDGERSFDEINFTGQMSVDYTPSESNKFRLGFYAGERTKDRTADILYYQNTAEYQGQQLYQIQYFNENLRTRKGDFVLASLDYEHKFKNLSTLESSFLYEYTLLGGPTSNLNLGWPNTDFVYQEEYNTNDNPLNGIRYSLDFKSVPGELGLFEAGYQFRSLDHVGDFFYERKNNETGLFELVPEFSSNVELRRKIHSLYSLLSGSDKKFEYVVGVRFEYMDRQLDLKDRTGTLDTTYLYNFIMPFPSVNLEYSFSDNFKGRAGYGKRVQRTTTFKMNPFPEREHSETLEQGDPNLLPEFVDNFELGVTKNVRSGSVFFTTYYRQIQNLVNRVNTVYNDTILNRIYSNVGRARSLGFEIGSELEPTENWNIFAGGNLYQYQIEGEFDDRPVSSSSWIYNFNFNTTIKINESTSIQGALNYLSARNTAQGEDSQFYQPSIIFTKKFFDNRLTADIQWLNMDMGLLDSNEMSIMTTRPEEFYTITNYVYEVDMIIFNLSYLFNNKGRKGTFIKSEFGEKEF